MHRVNPNVCTSQLIRIYSLFDFISPNLTPPLLSCLSTGVLIKDGKLKEQRLEKKLLLPATETLGGLACSAQAASGSAPISTAGRHLLQGAGNTVDLTNVSFSIAAMPHRSQNKPMLTSLSNVIPCCMRSA